VDGGVQYEAAIPWAAIHDSNSPPGDRIRFAAILNDNDGEGRRGWVEWTNSIGANKAASNLAILGLEGDDTSWGGWLDADVQPVPVGETVTAYLYVVNYSTTATAIEATFSTPPIRNTAIDLPGHAALRAPIEFTPTSAGAHTISGTVGPSEGAKKTVAGEIFAADV
jgi:hypothetical protein